MKKVAAVFSGQGSQYVGMGKDLYQNYPIAKGTFDKASEILGRDIISTILESDKENLTKTENAQIAVFVTSIAAYRVFESECDVLPVVAAGHSLGELSALTAAGAFSFEEALLLVRDRAMYMKNACQEKTGMMCAISNMLPSEVIKLCETKENIWISNINTKKQVVISGEKEKVQFFAEELKEKGALVTELQVAGAFHSGLMKNASESMKSRVQNITINEPVIPVISNTNAKFEGKNDIAKNIYRQIVMPVLWSETIKRMIELGVQAVVEFGAGHALSNMIRTDSNGTIETFLFEKSVDIKETISSINERYEVKPISFFEKCLAIAVCTKNRNENVDDYNKNVVDNMSIIRELNDSGGDSKEDRNKATEALKNILVYKKDSEDVIREKMAELAKI